ncbi:MAG: type 4a pilus biogenesis protein PilO [Gemmatimonadales bacterium]|nr:type 4a pilus biogenesis protein PilO [Gemmatimonadales bacterium]
MAGLPTNQRDQAMLAVAILAIAGAALYWNYVYSPKNEQLDQTRAHIERLDASNQRAKALVARGSVAQLQEEAKRLQSNLDLMRTLIPTGNEVPALLDQILGAARRVGLEFSDFAPNATVQGESFDTYRFRMSMQGNYNQIGELLSAIGSLQRVIVPTNVQLVASNAPAARSARADVRILTATFDIQTYVVRTQTGVEP